MMPATCHPPPSHVAMRGDACPMPYHQGGREGLTLVTVVVRLVRMMAPGSQGGGKASLEPRARRDLRGTNTPPRKKRSAHNPFIRTYYQAKERGGERG